MTLVKNKVFLLLSLGLVALAIIFVPMLFGQRPLTEEEHDLLSFMYGANIDIDSIRIKSGGPLTLVYPGITLGNVISFPKDTYHFSKKKDQALLVHEACHVWQYQHFGLDYIPRSVWELLTQKDTYVIHYDTTKSLRDYDIEEQCEIIADVFLTNRAEYLPYLHDLKIIK